MPRQLLLEEKRCKPLMPAPLLGTSGNSGCKLGAKIQIRGSTAPGDMLVLHHPVTLKGRVHQYIQHGQLEAYHSMDIRKLTIIAKWGFSDCPGRDWQKEGSSRLPIEPARAQLQLQSTIMHNITLAIAGQCCHINGCWSFSSHGSDIC